MAPAIVYLHIGSPKTGTTYLQASMWANQDVLAADGVLLGKSRTAVTKAIRDLLNWHPGQGDLPVTWRRLRNEVARWPGRSVVLSHEHLHKATQAQFDAIADSFPGARLEVVLTVRDLARAVPAQWQSSVRQRHTWTLGEYADALTAETPGTEGASPEKSTGAAEHFWRRQDAPAILRQFVERLSVEQVRVVTVPASGGDPDELWRRFSRACDLGTATTAGEVKHESLGAASAEVMRRLNGSPLVEGLNLAEYKKVINHVLSRHSLAPRRGAEPGLALPERHGGWAEEQAERMIEQVMATGVEVIGDLEDLRPRPSSKPYVDPDQLPADQLLEAALAGLGGMALQHLEVRAQLKEKSARSTPTTPATPSAPTPLATPAPAPPAGEPERPSGVGRVLRRLQRGS